MATHDEAAGKTGGISSRTSSARPASSSLRLSGLSAADTKFSQTLRARERAKKIVNWCTGALMARVPGVPHIVCGREK